MGIPEEFIERKRAPRVHTRRPPPAAPCSMWARPASPYPASQGSACALRPHAAQAAARGGEDGRGARMGVGPGWAWGAVPLTCASHL